MRIAVAFGLVLITAAGPALADWRIRTSGTTAGIWIRNEDGTSLALNCEGAFEGRMRMDLTVTAIPEAPDPSRLAQFQVGGFSVDLPTEPYGPEGQRLQILRIDVPYEDSEIAELRRQLQRGNTLNLPAQPEYEAVSFPLRGSSAAVDQLEVACLNVWEIARSLRDG